MKGEWPGAFTSPALWGIGTVSTWEFSLLSHPSIIPLVGAQSKPGGAFSLPAPEPVPLEAGRGLEDLQGPGEELGSGVMGTEGDPLKTPA